MKTYQLQQLVKICQLGLEDHPERKKDGFLHWSFLFIDGTMRFMATNNSGTPLKQLGYNRIDKDTGLPNQKIHSENAVLFKSWMSVKGATIVNVRLGNSGKLRNSCPYPTCQ